MPITPAITPARSAWSLTIPIAAATSGRVLSATSAPSRCDRSGTPTTTIPPFDVLVTVPLPASADTSARCCCGGALAICDRAGALATSFPSAP